MQAPSRPPLFSLVIPTLNRLAPLRLLFTSMQNSICQDFEVIVVDQNSGPLLDELCAEFAKVFPLQQIKITSEGVSRARNLGFPLARGSIVNFPDDDCELTPTLLSQVAEHFAADSSLDMLFARTVAPDSLQSSVTKFVLTATPVTAQNLFGTTAECTMFLRREVFTEVGALDQKLGVGTYFGAEEGSDFVLRALYKHKTIRYDPALLFYHPQKVGDYNATERARAFGYGRGFGRLSVKHLFLYRQPSAALRFLHFQFRTLCAVLLFATMFKFAKSRFYWSCFTGRLTGAILSLKDYCCTKP